MNNEIASQLLQETLQLAEEEEQTKTKEQFTNYVQEMLPPELLGYLESINGDSAFLDDIYDDRYAPVTVSISSDSDSISHSNSDDIIPFGYCLICERHCSLTRHHVYPRETHKKMIKQGIDNKALQETIAICRMCHSTIHRFFSNDELARSYYTMELLLSNEKYYKYAKWASMQPSRKR